jgi:DNA-binding NtrC family response regulator
MDIRLKGSVDGLETAEAIPKHCDMTWIYLTAYADSENLVRARLAGSFGFILEPFE